MAKKSMVQGLKLSRSGKYTFQFIEGMEERWQLSMKQAEIDLKLDVMGFEAKQKLYKQSLDTIDAEMKELRRTRENILDGNSTKKTAANKAAASAKQTAAQFNARAVDSAKALEIRNKQSARNTTTAAINQQRAREAAGASGTGSRGGRTTSASKITPLATREAIVSQNETTSDHIGTSLMVLGDGFPDYQQPTDAEQQMGAEAIALQAVVENIQTNGRAGGTVISETDALGMAKSQYALQGKEADYIRLRQSYDTLTSPDTTGTGGTYTPYEAKRTSSVGGYKPSQVKAYTYSPDLRDETSTNQDLLALQNQRNALVAPTAPVFDLIGQSRETYRNKFGTDGTYRGSAPAQQINRLGELYSPEQIQAALSQAGFNATPVAPPVAPPPVAPPVVPAPVEVPVEVPEVVTPPKNPVLTEVQEKVSTFAELMAKAGEAIKGLLPKKNDSRKQKQKRAKMRQTRLMRVYNADPSSPKGKAFEIYRTAKHNGQDLAATLELVSKAFGIRGPLKSQADLDKFNKGHFVKGSGTDKTKTDTYHGDAHEAKLAVIELFLLGTEI